MRILFDVILIQMISEKFENIISKTPTTLSQGELLEFQAYCSARSFSLQQWLDASITIYKSNPQQCYQILTYLDKHELAKPIYNDYVHQGSKINIYNILTGIMLAKATRESSKEQAEKFINEAKRFLNSSQKVRMTVDKSIILNRAFLHYYGGEITKALNFVSRTYEEILKTGEGKHLLVTTGLVLAQIYFVKKNYQKALQLYKKCLQHNKSLPTKARLGMAYSFYYLGKYEMARACFKRILQLDPNCVEAYLGIAVIEDKDQNNVEYFKALSSAYQLNKEHPLTLLHLAEHFLLRDQLQKAYALCQTGLIALEKYPKFSKIEESCRNDYQELKARFNNIMGQVHHINSNFADAIKYYTLATGKGLYYNQISLAQTYLNPSSLNYIESLRLLDQVYKQFDGKDARLISDSYRLMGYLKSKIPPKSKDDKGAQYYYGEALKFNRKQFQSKIEYANILVETNKLKALRQLQEAQKIQLSLNGTVKPELQNNIAVLELQNGQPEQSQQRLLKCIKSVDQMQCESEEDELKKSGLQIIVRFNYALSLERQMRWQSAKKVYESILNINRNHLDSQIRLAYTQFQLGNHLRIKEIFEQSQHLCSENKYKILRPEKILIAKAYLQHLGGSSHTAKQTLKQLGKGKDIYVQVFELCINYQNIMRKGVEMSTLKDFLRPNREFCYKYCSQDPYATFAYMLLAIILLADKKFTKSQGIQFFNNLKQFSSDQLPTILYNMGLFLSNYDDYDSSNAVLGLFKDKVGINSKADQLISMNYLLENQFSKSQSYVKRNILRDPSNLKHRMQLAYVLQRRSLKYYEKGDFSKKGVTLHSEHLRRCMLIQNHFSKMVINDYLRGIQIPQLKERIRNTYIKIKAGGQERKFYIKSYLDSYDKVSKEIEIKQLERLQIERKNQERLLNLQKEKELQQLLEEGQESQDEEEKQRREKEKKRQRALQLAKKHQAQMEIAWNELKQKEKVVDQEKKSRKRNTSTKPSAPRARKEKPKQESESPLGDLPDQQSQASAQLSESEPEQQIRKKHKHDKKEKKKKKQRAISDEDGYSQNDGQKSEKKAPEKEDQDDDDDLLKNYMA